MKKTIALIITLIVLASFLLIYALSSKPANKRNTLTKLTPSYQFENSTPDTSLMFSPDTLTFVSTDSATIDININTGSDKVTGVQLELAYDPKALSDVEIQPGTFLPSANVLLDLNDQSAGRLSYALVLPPTQPPVTGIGRVATLKIKRNPLFPTPSQTTITILPKSLVTALGANKSVLKSAKSVMLIFPEAIPTAIIKNPTVSTVIATPKP